jgi:hypothetical protein
LALAVLLSLMGFAVANSTAPATATLATGKIVNCCDDPTCYPGCCPECPQDCIPASQQAQGNSFTCPLTGEELPCPNCCPLSQLRAKASPKGQ